MKNAQRNDGKRKKEKEGGRGVRKGKKQRKKRIWK